MSAKIYDGFRFRARGLTNVHALIQRWRHTLDDLHRVEVATWAANRVVAMIDGHVAGGSAAPAYPLMDAVQELLDRQKAIKTTGRRDPTVDFDFTVAIIPHGRLLLGIIYTEQAEWRKQWMAMPEVEPWPYWDNTDPPDGMTPRQWARRGRIWGAALTQGPAPTPAMCGFEARCTVDFVRPSIDEVLACLPSKLDRATRLARKAEVDRYMRPASGSVEVAMQAYHDAMDWLAGDEGEAEVNRRASEIEPILSTLGPTEILGWDRNAQ